MNSKLVAAEHMARTAAQELARNLVDLQTLNDEKIHARMAMIEKAARLARKALRMAKENNDARMG